jgi:hypothetical protein
MGKTEKRPVYTCEDWKKEYHSQPSIPSMSYCIPPEELEKIKIEQKRLFGERVERMEERYKDDYQKKANSSLDLANLQKGEIEFIEDLFYNKNFRTPISNTEGAILANSKKVIWGIGQITGIRLRQVRDAYKKWVIDGETDYSYVKFNDRFDSFNDVPVAVVALKLYYDWVKSFPIVTTQQTETKEEQETPETFESLFYNKNLVNPCINILKEIEPPLIDNDCNFLGRVKSGILIWIDEMQRQAVIKKGYPQERKLLALLIPLKIKGFAIDESMFSKNSVRAERQYRTDIKAMVSELKLSQNSQTES